MVQVVDDESDIFTHININIVRFGEQLRCLVDKVCRQDAVDDAVLVVLIEFL